MKYSVVLVDDPAPKVRRVTLNRPEKRNALNEALRTELMAALEEADADPDVNVMILRGAGKCFSAGYDLGGTESYAENGTLGNRHIASGAGSFQRLVTETFMGIWDLAKPVIAQVHSHCLAGGSELATCCDLVYVADDLHMGYPAVRFGTPDNQFHSWFLGMRTAMEMMLTGDPVSATEAVQRGWANRAFPAADLEDEVLEVAKRIALIPPGVAQINKRSIHRAMDTMGLRASIRAGTELSALATYQPGFQEFLSELMDKGVTDAVQKRDAPFNPSTTESVNPSTTESVSTQGAL